MNRQMQALRAMPGSHVEVAAATALTVVLLGGLLTLSAMSSAAGQASRTGTSVVQPAAASDAADNQETFRARVRNELAEWRVKMQGFNKRTQADGKRHADAAETRLRKAWNKTKVEASRVQSATERDWEGVKASYDTAARELAAAWDKVRT